MQSLLHLLSSDPAWIRTGFRVVHFCGLVLGVCAATLLDLIIARFVLMRGISYEHVYVVDFSSKIVTVGLVLLWISGIGFLIHYGVVDPDKLQNPKIWAKIAIVVVLSLNGFLVHFFVLPRIRNQVGKRLLDGLSQFHCSLVLLAGTVSAISWYVPLMLGAIPQLNYVVPAEVILVSYALLLIAVSTLIQAAIVFFVGRVFDTRHFRPEQNEHVARIVRAGLALICGSLFMTKATDYGEAFVESATSSCWCTQSFFAPKAADLKPASSPGDSTPVFPVLSSSNRTRELLEILRSLLCGRTKVSRNEFPAVKERFRRTVGSGCACLPASPGDGKRSSLLDRQVLIHAGFDCIRILRLKADLNRRKIIVACAGRKRGAGLEFASEETAFLVVQPM